MSAPLACLDHAAFHVRDIAFHIAFFRDVLGMTVTKLDGDPDDPKQAWLLGGIQLIRDAEFTGPEGRFGHLGIICQDLPATIAAAEAYGAVATAKGPHWLLLPDGLLLELMAQKGDAVRIIRSVDPRA
ncbi:VOC family protein [Gemmobacter fulvus]|uniref:VOC family protein n=1 Tax=Gemmobacter fulvus TaxID=2840474 RepID=A0A975P4F6_9RHOB|nr:VOC family protein [Gemmobacter fulvus]MBT9246724.1 VOC family protein [Gemmobacter fulvus]MDQ1846789.1 VOC family protein [Gemmobacter fulvus]QWK89172.1 VOC family protein [Gemmobacter fulvus]